MNKPNTEGTASRRDREIAGSGFTVRDQLVAKYGKRAYGALLDQLNRTTRPARGRKTTRPPRVRKVVAS